VLGDDVEKLTITTGAKIVQRFEDIDSSKLGTAKRISEQSFGASCKRMLLIEGETKLPCATGLIRGGNKLMVAGAERSIHGALWVSRNLIRDNRIGDGGCESEVDVSVAMRREEQKVR
jgi:T-complex protein 1 subunit epsilon